ncbi:hypothetical protein Jiend_54930 [Micromonospora endophytica]|nr:hypothetical protein Jiend_54930 [Micromonospora endophytica]
MVCVPHTDRLCPFQGDVHGSGEGIEPADVRVASVHREVHRRPLPHSGVWIQKSLIWIPVYVMIRHTRQDMDALSLRLDPIYRLTTVAFGSR